MSLFKAGEIAIIKVACQGRFPVGAEVPIVEVMEQFAPLGVQHYIIDKAADGRCLVACDRCLRKKPPPPAGKREAVGSWEHCHWRPRERVEI